MTALPPDKSSEQPATVASGQALAEAQAPIALDGGDDGTGTPVATYAVAIIGLLLFLSVPLLLYVLVALWPEHQEGSTAWLPDVYVFGTRLSVQPEPRFIYLVVIASAIGSFIAVATSFTTYLGNQRLYTRWIWWYILRLPIGIALAVLSYFAVRGGSFTTNASEADVNPFGVAALGGFVGMFSERAADKLQDVFVQLLDCSRDKGRGDKLA